ncbi:MAG: hypothetical protein M1546_11250 [Chloroflexi bacterium]|nr:hypothetical protein [Chloroflexota bacterium]
MTFAASKPSAVDPGAPVYVDSAPTEKRWGQLPASYYSFRIENGVMYGNLISGVYQSVSSAFDESCGEQFLALELESWQAAASEALVNFEAMLESEPGLLKNC